MIKYIYLFMILILKVETNFEHVSISVYDINTTRIFKYIILFMILILKVKTNFERASFFLMILMLKLNSNI